ncbi:hypothetical protein AJ88_05220 [Mesorhizobium amorphae CCBAU 01583]|nr:hypothetical protein AJ88_05220 [Mesorhizobium amorphae CCBAU 01583]
MITGRFFAAGADRRIAITILILLAAAIVVPLLNLAVSPASAFYIPSYVVALTGKYLCTHCSLWRSTWSGAIAASSRSAMAPSSRSAAMRWECI